MFNRFYICPPGEKNEMYCKFTLDDAYKIVLHYLKAIYDEFVLQNHKNTSSAVL